ncbi:MAG TPA: PEP-CTERM sorting domain-containing protein [Phycisphaerae bacterium]|nr:PEP-CTERM sorting domain-containing protein [Phycisphaerae bacterium]HRY67674.1 PEP-CTERM sorting domain-containing protein [Phycisphaerae bacterium]HSA25061.1 PEP-CTERM sorting domain-containing protein [Phycisphaerae bacterium]
MISKKLWTVCAVFAVTAGSSGALGTFYNLGAGTSTGISSDGSVVSFNNNGAYIWTPGSGAKGIGAGYSTAGVAVGGSGISDALFGNADKVIVGANAGGSVYYWVGDTSGTGTWSASLGTGTAYCTSASASNFWIGGNQGTSSGSRTAYRYKYSSNSWSSLSLPSNYNKDAYIYGISNIGSYAGRAQYGAVSPGGARGAVAGGTLAGLDPLIGAMSTSVEAVANAISRDGSRAGGWSTAAGGIQRQGTIWQVTPFNKTPVVAIPFIGTDNYDEVQALNSDGTIAAGYGRDLTAGTRRLWIWDATNGSRDLSTLVPDLASGWTNLNVRGLSGDGLTIVGDGTFGGMTTAWVAIVPEPATFGLLVLGGLTLLRRQR